MENKRDPRNSWIECHEPKSTSKYYFNLESNELSWVIPETEKCITVRSIDPTFQTYIGRIINLVDINKCQQPILRAHPGEIVIVLHMLKNGSTLWAKTIKGISGFIDESSVQSIVPDGRPIPLTHSVTGGDFVFGNHISNGALIRTQSRIITNNQFSTLKRLTSSLSENLDLTFNTLNFSLFEENESHATLMPRYDLYPDYTSYDLITYSNMYFRRSSNTIMGKKNAKSFEYTGKKLSASLLPLNDEENRLAIDMNYKILLYTGTITVNNHNISNDIFRDEIFSMSVKSYKLLDELYLQIIRHTLNNPYESSCLLGWELLAYLCSAYEVRKASPHLYPYILNYFIRMTGYTQRSDENIDKKYSYSEEGESQIRAMAFYCSKCLVVFHDTQQVSLKDLLTHKHYHIPVGAYKCSLDDITNLESISSLFYNYGLLGKFDPLYGATIQLNRNRSSATNFFSPESVLQLLLTGVYTNITTYNNNKESKLYHVYVSIDTYSLIIENIFNNKIESLIILNDYKIDLDESDDDNLSVKLIQKNNKLYYLILTFENLPERNRWHYSLKCFLNYLELVSNSKLYQNSSKPSFLSYIRNMIKDPNNYSANLVMGVIVDYMTPSDETFDTGLFYLSDKLNSFVFESINSNMKRLTYFELSTIELPTNDELKPFPSEMKKQCIYIRNNQNSKESWLISCKSNQSFTTWCFMLYCYNHWIKQIKTKEILIDIDSLDANVSEIHRKFNDFVVGFPTQPIQNSKQVPRLIHNIIKRLLLLPAHKTEGIFRLSCEKLKLDLLTDHLHKGYYEAIDIIDDPLVLAAALLKWLREMPVKLIPESMIEECLLVAKNQDKDPLLVVDKFPDINKNTLEFLCRYFKDLSKYHECTKMKITGFATVLAPDIFPFQKYEDDLTSIQTMIGNAIKFTEKLINVLPYPDPEYTIKP